MVLRFFILFISISYTLSSQVFAQEFTKAFGNSNNNIFENGYYSASHDAYFVVGASNGSTGTLTKVDRNGNVIWSKRFSGSYYMSAIAEIKAPDKSRTDVVLVPNDYGTYNDLYIMRIDGDNGNVLWSKKYKYSAANRFAGVVVTEDQQIIAANIIRYTGGLLLAKLDHNGNNIWSRLVTGSNFQRATEFVPDENNGFIFGCILGSNHGVAKFNSEGNVTFLKKYTTTNHIRNLKKNPDGTYLLSGYKSWETRDIDHELIYVDKDLNVIWAKYLNPVITVPSNHQECCANPTAFKNNNGDIISIRESRISGELKTSFSIFSPTGTHIKTVTSDYNDISVFATKYAPFNNIIMYGNSRRADICLPNSNNSLLVSVKDNLDICDTREVTPRITASNTTLVDENKNLLSVRDITFEITNPNIVSSENIFISRNLCSTEAEKVNLGPDITTCATGNITLNPGTGYKTYLWSTGAATTTIQVSRSGTYWVRTVDDCNRVSSDTIRVTFSSPTSRTQNIRICQGGSYRIGNKNYTIAGTYTDTLRASTGCDSIVRTVLAVDPRFSLQQNHTICQGDSIRVGTKIYKTAGTYRDTLSSIRGCDSIIISTLTIIPRTSRTQTLSICQGDSIRVGNKFHKATGTYRDTLKSVLNCDSIVVTNLTVRPVYQQQMSFNICQGDSVRVGNQFFKTAGTFTVNLKSIYNCDSVIRATVVVRSRYSNQQNVTLCQGQSVRVGTKTYTTTGLYRDTLKSIYGCDSIIITNLTVNPTFNRTQTLNICQGDSIRVGNKYYKTTGTYRDTLKTRLNCDSIVITNLTVRPVYQQQMSFNICQGDSVRIGNQFFKTSGTFTVNLKSIYNCDSIIRATVIVSSNFSNQQNITLCQGKSITVGNKTYTTTGVYRDTLKSAFGCDSIITTNLTVNPTFNRTQTLRICQGDSITVGNKVYKASGTFRDTLKTLLNCDSIIVTNLTVNPRYQQQLTYNICQGDSITIGNQVFKNKGSYTVNLKSIYNCDSIIIATINVSERLTTNIDTTICQGSSIQIGNNNYAQSGTYTNTLTSSSGCDSVVTLKLAVLESVTQTQSFKICKGDSIVVGTDKYTSSGEYTYSLKYPNGCDSILIHTSLTVDEPISFDLGRDTTLCAGDFITLTTNISGQNIQWSTGSTESSIDVYNSGTYSVQASNTCGTFNDSIQVDFEDCDCKVFIPNAFSPNGDGKNDVLIIKEENITASRIIIYNKWGEEVFAAENNQSKWNGIYKNKQLSPDVYGYYYTGTCLKGNLIELKGNITIVR